MLGECWPADDVGRCEVYVLRPAIKVDEVFKLVRVMATMFSNHRRVGYVVDVGAGT